MLPSFFVSDACGGRNESQLGDQALLTIGFIRARFFGCDGRGLCAACI